MSAPKIVMMPVAQIRLTKRNARTHSKRQIAQLSDSIARFGWTDPIVVAERNRKRSRNAGGSEDEVE